MINQKQTENVDYFSYLLSMITNNVRCTREIKCWFAMVKAAFDKNEGLFTSKLDLNLRNKLELHLSIALYGAEIWTLREVDRKYLKRFEM
jgi:hypothetical protein